MTTLNTKDNLSNTPHSLLYAPEDIEKLLKKYSSISSIQKKINLNQRTIKKILTRKYGEISIVEIKKKLKIKGKVTRKKKNKILRLFKLYQESGNLKAASQSMGVSESRGSQILHEGNKIGLIKYNPTWGSNFQKLIQSVSKKEFIFMASKTKNRDELCSRLGVRYHVLAKLLKYYGVNYREYCMLDGKNQELMQKIKELIQSGYGLNGIKNQIGIGHSKIKRLMFRRYGEDSFVKIKRILGVRRKLSKKSEMNIKRAHELYQKYGTLEAVGKEMNFTRERIRQLLQRGQTHGLFEYKLHREREREELIAAFSRDRIIEVLEKHETIKEFKEELGITESERSALFDYYKIDALDFIAESKKKQCLKEYLAIVNDLGDHPTTTQMSTRPSWRNVWTKIWHYWGSVAAFRKEYGISIPKRKWPEKARAAWKKEVELKMQKKEEKKRNILSLVKQDVEISSGSIRKKLGFKVAMISIYLRELQGANLIRRVGTGSKTRYVLVADEATANKGS